MAEVDLERVDEALLRLRRMFAQPDRLRMPDGTVVEASTILVVEAVTRLGSADVQISQIAAYLQVAPSTASRLVAKAAAAGMVKPAESKHDPRAKAMTVTLAGRQLRAEAFAHRLRTLAELTRDWDRADVAAFAALLGRFAAGYGKQEM